MQVARRSYKRAVNKAKNGSETQALERIHDSRDIYKITRVERPTLVAEPPPLQIDGVTHSMQIERAHALKAHILDRRDASDGLPASDYSGAPAQQIQSSRWRQPDVLP